MKVRARLDDAKQTLNGELVLSFVVSDKKAIDKVLELKDELLDLEVAKHREKRSLDANAYMWVLIDKIAKVMKLDKWTVYLMFISDYGVFFDYRIPIDAYDGWASKFRYTEILEENEYSVVVRSYFGSSTYNTKEMADILDRVVEMAESLGIDTWSEDEVKAVLSAWKGNGDGESY